LAFIVGDNVIEQEPGHGKKIYGLFYTGPLT